MSFLNPEQSQEFQKVFGDVPNPSTREYDEGLLNMIRSRYTHEQIMAGQFTFPVGYGIGDSLALAVRIAAAIVAYVPVFGTAVAFVLNTATSIAEGKRIDAILIDGVRGALPGQPASTIAFDAVRAIAQGEPIDEILIDSIPYVSPQVKDYIKVGIRIVSKIADGESITDIALDEIYYQLPPDGKKAFDLARRVANGENVGDIVLQQGAAYLKDAGKEKVNEYLANVGYQQLLNYVPPEIRSGLTAGAAIAYALRLQEGAPVGTVTLTKPEREFKTRNDALAVKGFSIAVSNFEITSRRNLTRFLPQITTNDEWRRGFDIATAFCQGLGANSPEQDSVRMSIGSISGRNGFVVGRDLQYRITNKAFSFSEKATPKAGVAKEAIIQNLSVEGLVNMAMSLGKIVTAGDRNKLVSYAADGARISAADPQVAAGRGLSDNGEYRWGFDIGTSVGKGNSIPGPGQQAARNNLGPFMTGGSSSGVGQGSNEALRGFDVGQAIQHGITKLKTSGGVVSNNSSVAAGQLVATGLSGSSVSADQKAATVATVATNPLAKQGVSAVIEEKKGIFTRILEFFGLM